MRSSRASLRASLRRNSDCLSASQATSSASMITSALSSTIARRSKADAHRSSSTCRPPARSREDGETCAASAAACGRSACPWRLLRRFKPSQRRVRNGCRPVRRGRGWFGARRHQVKRAHALAFEKCSGILAFNENLPSYWLSLLNPSQSQWRICHSEMTDKQPRPSNATALEGYR